MHSSADAQASPCFLLPGGPATRPLSDWRRQNPSAPQAYPDGHVLRGSSAAATARDRGSRPRRRCRRAATAATTCVRAKSARVDGDRCTSEPHRKGGARFPGVAMGRRATELTRRAGSLHCAADPRRRGRHRPRLRRRRRRTAPRRPSRIPSSFRCARCRAGRPRRWRRWRRTCSSRRPTRRRRRRSRRHRPRGCQTPAMRLPRPGSGRSISRRGLGAGRRKRV